MAHAAADRQPLSLTRDPFHAFGMTRFQHTRIVRGTMICPSPHPLGSTNPNVLPWPGDDSTQIQPPWTSINEREM